MLHLLDAHGGQATAALAGGCIDCHRRSAETVAGAALAKENPDWHLERELLGACRTSREAIDPVDVGQRVRPEAFALAKVAGVVGQSELSRARIAGRYQNLSAARSHRAGHLDSEGQDDVLADDFGIEAEMHRVAGS